MDLLDDEPDPQPSRFEAYGAPEVLAPAGFAIGLASLLGYGLLSGTIVLALAADNGMPSRGAHVLAGLVGAGLAAVPLLMGLTAVRRLREDDPLWVSGLARAAVLLSGVAVVLRLLHALATALADSGQYFGV